MVMRTKDMNMKSVPVGAGVYMFRNGASEIIYVGKAKSLKKRVKSYFCNVKRHAPRTRIMLGNADSVEYMLTDTEVEALVLESNLIKKYQPRYNVLLKDDKSYPYIRVSLEEDFPRVFITRRVGKKGSKYFGPYPETFEIKKILKYLNQLFGIRTCRDKKFVRLRACINYDICLCSAPCTGRITKGEYLKNIGDLMLFLSGKDSVLLEELEKKMRAHSERREYEAAKQYRDRIEGVKKLSSQQKIVSQKNEDIDVICGYKEDRTTIVQLFFIRGGSLISKTNYVFRDPDACVESILNSFLKQYYAKHEIPKTILISHDVEDRDIIAGWLTKETKCKIKIIIPKRGGRYKLMQLAQKNAKMNLDEQVSRYEKNRQALEMLRKELGLRNLPERIEAFDISNISGKFACGSMVVFVHGEPKKSEYRRYRIKTVEGIDDYAMMSEVIERRYCKHDVPDLILIDGGKGQLNAALGCLRRLKKDDAQILGLAKGLEEIYLPGKIRPVSLRADSLALYLLQRVRDEAHRFAVSYHRVLRSKSIAD